ncbi:hypothetical protein QJS04_geneDACA012760 [Acorus gramineus]|uniref:Uncharacterized protein n=1 Tax=Acorus gramineus TaxID=55184 RepID=A0AAV9A063_ACOGR|nr:hypothetical protein QJS04_geneDACA012760 [Acorus gramineus]
MQMKPSYISKKINGGSSSGANAFQVDNGNIGCPSGTVPILRTAKEDLVRVRSISNSIYDTRKNISSNSDPPVLNHVSVHSFIIIVYK